MIRIKARALGAFFVLSLLFVSVQAWAGPELDVHILDNGLKAGIINTGSSHVLIELRVGAGFIDEGPSETGVAHWLEHGVFRGTKKFPTKQLFEKELKRLGIQYNASTTFERTNFFFIAPKERLKEALELFAEMVGRPVLDPKAMKDELEPVKQEALRDQVNPAFDLFMASLSLHAKTARMAQPMTGTVEQMDTQSGELPKQFHDRWYSSDNMTMAIVGGVDDVDATRTLVDKVFGDFAKFLTPPRGSFKEELKLPKNYKMYKVKAEPGSRRLLNVAFPIEYNLQNWAAATLFADYLNREDSPLSMLTQAGLSESAGISVDTFQDVMYVRMIIDLTAKGEANIEAVHTMGAMAFGAMQKAGMPDHLIEESKASFMARGMEGSYRQRLGKVLKSGINTNDFATQQSSLMGLGDLISDGLAGPEGEKDISLKQEALLKVTGEDIRWLMTQMPPERAQLTLRTPNSKGQMNTTIGREVEAVDMSALLPGLQKAYESSDLPFDSLANNYLGAEKPRHMRAQVEIGPSKVKRTTLDIVVFPLPDGSPATAILEFRFPKTRMTPTELVAVEVSMKAFELERSNRIFFDHISRAGISLSFKMDKSHMRMLVQASGPSKKTAQALQEFMNRWRTFKPTEELVAKAKEQIKDGVRAMPMNEVSRQAVSAGIKKITGGKFIDPNQKISLTENVNLAMVEKLTSGAQKSWAVRGTIGSSWEDATLEKVVGLMISPNPIPTKTDIHSPDLREYKYKPMEGLLSGVERQGVARLYPMNVAQYSVEQYAMEIFAKVLADRLMQTVRTDLKLVYAVGSDFVLLPTGGAIYLTGDTSQEATKVLEGYELVMREFLSHGMTDDEFKNAQGEVFGQFKSEANSIDGVFARSFKGFTNPQELGEAIQGLSASKVMLMARDMILKSRKLDSVILGPKDSLCESLLEGMDMQGLALPKVAQ